MIDTVSAAILCLGIAVIILIAIIVYLLNRPINQGNYQMHIDETEMIKLDEEQPQAEIKLMVQDESQAYLHEEAEQQI